MKLGVGLLGLAVAVIRATARFRQRHLQSAMTSHTVRCPLHACSAKVAVYTRQRPHNRPRFVDVVSCSFLPHTRTPGVQRRIAVPDFPTNIYAWEPVSDASEAPVVSCSKRCLGTLAAAQACRPLPPPSSHTRPVSNLEVSAWPEVLWRI